MNNDSIAMNIQFEGDLPALFTALSKAQAEMPGVHKGSVNPFYKSKYADINDVLEAVMPSLTSNGLCLMQFPGWDAASDMATMTTVLAHTTGARMISIASCPVPRPDVGSPQDLGKIITYMRRYCCVSALAIPQDDDDGNASEKQKVALKAPAKKVAVASYTKSSLNDKEHEDARKRAIKSSSNGKSTNGRTDATAHVDAVVLINGSPEDIFLELSEAFDAAKTTEEVAKIAGVVAAHFEAKRLGPKERACLGDAWRRANAKCNAGFIL